jgi:hypothetical protein
MWAPLQESRNSLGRGIVHAQAGTASRQIAQLDNALAADSHQSRWAIEAHAFECTSLNKGTRRRLAAFHALVCGLKVNCATTPKVNVS